MKTRLICDAKGNPFHLPGTKIYREPDGSLTYECPHCHEHPVPSHMVAALAKHAKRRA